MRKTLLLLAILVAPLAVPTQAYACSCVYYEPGEQRFIASYDQADLIILGTPIEFTENLKAYDHIYNVGVEKVWKGQADAYIDIHTGSDSGACGIDLPLNEPFVIFAQKYDGEYSTGQCSGTVAASDEVMTWLNNYLGPPVPKPESEPVLNDCRPYICNNGDSFPACTEDGTFLAYFVAPCQFSGGEVGEEPPVDVPSNDFEDVPTSHKNYIPISFVKDEGIVEGYNDKTYRPQKAITRDEFTKIIVEATSSRDEIDACTTDNLFLDISENDWSYKHVCTAKKRHIVDGYDTGMFLPGNTLNFAEGAKIVVNAFGIPVNQEDLVWLANRSSVEQSEGWWRPFVFALARVGGLPSSFTDPNQVVTREDMANMIYLVMMGIQ